MSGGRTGYLIEQTKVFLDDEAKVYCVACPHHVGMAIRRTLPSSNSYKINGPHYLPLLFPPRLVIFFASLEPFS